MNLQKLAVKIDKYIYYILLLTVAVIPLKQELMAGLIAVNFLLALFVACFKKKTTPKILEDWQQYALYLLFTIGIISIYFSKDRFLSGWNYLYVGGQYLGLVFVLLRYGLLDAETYDKVREQGTEGIKEKFFAMPRPLQMITVMLIVSIFVSLIGIAQKILGITGEGIWVDPDQFPDLKVRVYSTLVNPNILGGYLVLVVAYAVGWFYNFYHDYRKLKKLIAATGLLALVCLLYTYSRGNWIAAVVMLFAFTILFCKRAALPVTIAGLIGLAMGGRAVIQRLTSITSGEDTSAALRIAYLESTVAIIEDFPFGVGWYGYRFVYPDYNFYLDDTSVIMYHCHNMFLNVWSELGLHGLIVFLLVWGMFIKAGYKLAHEGTAPWFKAMGMSYVIASVGIAVGGLTDHVYFNTQMGCLFWLTGILTMICYRLNKINQNNHETIL
ncbi:MAG: O-antigen ligase family protein [Phascolarctobacterium sp.]|nr:O-antigen ligase family protein [Phascolarctobacterium sp.]